MSQNIQEGANTCDCCMMGWGEPNEFGLCTCWCSECSRPLSTCRYNHGINAPVEVSSNTSQNGEYQTDGTLTQLGQLGQALRHFNKGQYYGTMSKDDMMYGLVEEVYRQVLAMETSERKKDVLAVLWRKGILRTAGVLTLNELMCDVDFDTGRLYEDKDEPWLAKEWMARFASDSVIMELSADHEDELMITYGFDQAMNDFFFTTGFGNFGSGVYRPTSFDGLSMRLAHDILTDCVFEFGVIMFNAIQPETFDFSKALTHVGECTLCSDEESLLFTLPCGHAFGTECTKVWGDTKKRNGEPLTCPMCRTRF